MYGLRTALVLTTAASLAACSGPGSPAAPQATLASTVLHTQDTQGGLPRGTGTMKVALGDAAPRLGKIAVQKIDLAVTEVDAVRNGTIMVVEKFSKPVVTDVLAHQQQPGAISIGQVAVGSYDHLRFVVDTTRSNVVGAKNASYPIRFETSMPSRSSYNAGSNSLTTQVTATTVAMTAPGNFMIDGVSANEVEADFNAFESLALDRSGHVIARATLFAAPSKVSGTVGGQVVNTNGGPVSSATIVLTDSLGNVANTTNTDNQGAFSMHTIHEGTYKVYVVNTYVTAAGQTILATGHSPGAGAGEMFGTVTVTGNHTMTLGRIPD